MKYKILPGSSMDFIPWSIRDTICLFLFSSDISFSSELIFLPHGRPQ